MASRRRPVLKWPWAAFVVLFFCVPLFVHLGHAELAGDEPIYAYAVDSILDQGDWLTPRAIPSQTEPFLEKPPLKFWIVAATMKAGLLPRNEFGQRFWDAVFGASAFLYVFALGLRLAGPMCGAIAVFILFVHQPLLFVHGLRSQTMEAALVLSYCGGIFHALAWSSAEGRAARWLHPAATAAFFVLGAMTKFVAAVFLPVILMLMSLTFAAWRVKFRQDWRAWTAAGLLSVAAIAPWFILQSIQWHDQFWTVIFREHVYRRMTTFLDPAHVQPWHYYFTAIYSEFAGNKTFFVVLAGLIAVIAMTVRHRWDAGTLILYWLFLPIAAISFGSSKLYHYAYPFLPPLALAGGFLPAVLLRRESSAHGVIERLGATLRRRAREPWMRIVALLSAALSVLAFIAALLTQLHGPLVLRVGDVSVIRNSSVVRPFVLGALLFVFAGQGRFGWRLLLPLLVMALLPLDAYRFTIERLDEKGAPLKQIAECLGGLTPRGEHGGIYVQPEDPGDWKYVYYFRSLGWQHPPERPRDVLVRKLFSSNEQQPVIASVQDYHDLKEAVRSAIAAVPLSDERLLLLPGPYAACAHATGARR